jgi:hypothetical protein
MKPGISEGEPEEQAKEKVRGDLESPAYTTPLTQTHCTRPCEY